MPNVNQPSYEVLLPTVKIASFNLLNYLEPPMAYYDFQNIYTLEQWHKKQAWITRFLDKNQPDIIGFQEVFSSESLQSLLEKAGYPYYAVIDSPTVIDDFICRSPVVAIASKFPITEISTVTADQQAAALLGLADFHFSRKPLRATIDIPHVGLTDCYVTHFKSKRSLFDDPLPDVIVPSNTALSRFAGQRLGSWGSAMLRGTEANLLLLAILKQRESSTHPMLLMGDFNDEISSSCLEQLIAGNVFGMSDGDIERLIGYYRLYDSWTLFTQNTEQTILPRPPTHYFGAKSSVLDYILLSQEFNAQYRGSLFEVSHYHTEDKHLVNNSFDEDGYSTDHAIPCVTLSLRS
ncbi:endonuclease/exonuclease/phosphatase family protein [Photobacterium iliopiscarium]|uniref:endonuclease/exonuclease/phosphatase family protein n=1 Tax=Photobacterium iliopiscarium TaxID=56192 RepID=UPI002432D517|nr:endonuclease/exonuclease/phosphatase family protein [Photobacterium iliopiscarium]